MINIKKMLIDTNLIIILILLSNNKIINIDKIDQFFNFFFI